jgi:hypothetical protein
MLLALDPLFGDTPPARRLPLVSSERERSARVPGEIRRPSFVKLAPMSATASVTLKPIASML